MKTDTSERILELVSQHDAATPHLLQEQLGISAQALFRQLKKLQDQGRLKKTGTPPRVFYSLVQGGAAREVEVLTPQLIDELDTSFFTITPSGTIEEGAAGFAVWCQRHHLPYHKTALEYVATLKKYQAFRQANGLIDGMPKLKATFDRVYLNQMWYLDFYSIERFGKTKLGALLLYSKQSQNQPLMQRLFTLVAPRIKRLVQEQQIQAICFIPPTVSRRIQFQRELERYLAISLPQVSVVKATGGVAVPQKTLNRLNDRIENAANSLFISDLPTVKRVLIIDDAVGSGASMNEVARKISRRQPSYIIGLAITGSFNGFEVVQEV